MHYYFFAMWPNPHYMLNNFISIILVKMFSQTKASQENKKVVLVTVNFWQVDITLSQGTTIADIYLLFFFSFFVVVATFLLFFVIVVVTIFVWTTFASTLIADYYLLALKHNNNTTTTNTTTPHTHTVLTTTLSLSWHTQDSFQLPFHFITIQYAFKPNWRLHCESSKKKKKTTRTFIARPGVESIFFLYTDPPPSSLSPFQRNSFS